MWYPGQRARVPELGLASNGRSTGVSCRYFEGGVSSVYLWDLDHGFAGVILIKKAGDGSKKIKGCWDSIHVVEVQVDSAPPQPAASLPVQDMNPTNSYTYPEPCG